VILREFLKSLLGTCYPFWFAKLWISLHAADGVRNVVVSFSSLINSFAQRLDLLGGPSEFPAHTGALLDRASASLEHVSAFPEHVSAALPDCASTLPDCATALRDETSAFRKGPHHWPNIGNGASDLRPHGNADFLESFLTSLAIHERLGDSRDGRGHSLQTGHEAGRVKESFRVVVFDCQGDGGKGSGNCLANFL